MHSRTASAVDGVLSGTLNGIRQGAELLHRAHSPVNDSGAAFSPGLLANKIDDLEQVIRNGPPARLSDLPTYAHKRYVALCAHC